MVDGAATLLPRNVPLKDPKDFKLIGTPAKRRDADGKVNGTAQFGIDVKIPGMKVATVAASAVASRWISSSGLWRSRSQVEAGGFAMREFECH
jgi:isoquinoline 1-oxidoreductase beta subunit